MLLAVAEADPRVVHPRLVPSPRQQPCGGTCCRGGGARISAFGHGCARPVTDER